MAAAKMAINAGSEKSTKPIKPPIKDAVVYIEIAVNSWVEVGPGIDWHIVSSSTNLSSFILYYDDFTISFFKQSASGKFRYGSLVHHK